MSSPAAVRGRRPQRATLPSRRFERFCLKHLRHVEGGWHGQPFALDPWQREVSSVILDTRDARTGLRRYREALIGIGKGNGKTPFGAAFALYGLVADDEPGAECYCLAGSKQQARILFEGARRMRDASPFLTAVTKPYRDAIEVPETNAVFRVLSSDSTLAHGYRPHIVVVDEVWAHKKPDLYEAMSSALNKRDQALLIGLTTAGYDKASLLGSIIARAELKGVDADPELYYRWFGARDGAKVTDTKAWREANPATWVTIAGLRAQRRRLPDAIFRRYHMNQWTTTLDTWISAELWDANDARPKIRLGDAVYIAVDAAPKNDTTAVVLVRRDANGHHHVLKWVFESDRMMGYLDYGAVEDLLRQLALTYDVRRMLFDPFTMMRSMIMLAEEGLPVEEFPQNDARMVPASQMLYDLVLEQRLHTGGDELLRSQALNAAARETSRGWRLHKLKSAGKIDSIVALAMASFVAEQDVDGGAVTPTILSPGR